MRRDYLRAINLYRQRVWTCKVTGHGGLSYEEALTSEARHAAIQQVCTFTQRLDASPDRAGHCSLSLSRCALKGIEVSNAQQRCAGKV